MSLIKVEDYLSSVEDGDNNEYYEEVFKDTSYFIAGQVSEVFIRYIKSKFPGAFFKYTHKSTRTALSREKIKYPRSILKEERPILAVTPTLKIGSDSRKMYQNRMFQENLAGMEDIIGDVIFMNESEEVEKNIKVMIVKTDMVMEMQTLFIFDSAGQAYDASTIIDREFISGATSIEMRLNIPLPHSMLNKMATRFGISLRNNQLDKPKEFISLMKDKFNVPLKFILDPALNQRRIVMSVNFDLLIETNGAAQYSNSQGRRDTGVNMSFTVTGIKPSYFIVKTNSPKFTWSHEPQSSGDNIFDTPFTVDGTPIIKSTEKAITPRSTDDNTLASSSEDNGSYISGNPTLKEDYTEEDIISPSEYASQEGTVGNSFNYLEQDTGMAPVRGLPETYVDHISVEVDSNGDPVDSSRESLDPSKPVLGYQPNMKVDENVISNKSHLRDTLYGSTDWIPKTDSDGKALVCDSTLSYESDNEVAILDLSEILDEEVLGYINWSKSEEIDISEIINVLYYVNSEPNTTGTFNIDLEALTLHEISGFRVHEYWVGIYINRAHYSDYIESTYE